MAYQPPVFNLVCNIWDCNWPEDADPDYTDVPCQKYIRSRMSLDVSPQAADGFWRVYTPPIQLRFPRNHEAFTGPPALWPHNCFEVPAGSGQYYRAYWQEVQHQGFPNEYAIILVNPCTAAGLAIGPPLAEYGLGTTPDICPAPAPPVVESHDATFWLRDDASTGMVSVAGRRQDETAWYSAQYDCSGMELYIRKFPDDPFPVILASQSLSNPPGVGDFVTLFLLITDDHIEARIITLLEDFTISTDDSSYPTGIGGGIMIGSSHECSLYHVYYDVTGIASDNFSDTPGTDLSAHTMIAGSGWFYGSTGSLYEINAAGDMAVNSVGSSYNIVMTDYPPP